jgi:uncharacterized membrane-anchored protein
MQSKVGNVVTRLAGVFCFSCVSLLAPDALAQTEPAQAAEPAAAPAEAAQPEAAQPEAAQPEEPSPWQQGPKKIELGSGIALDLPADYDFLAMPEAGKLMESMGNLYNENLLGLVAGRAEDSPWFITLRYDEEGYVKDDENVDGDALLEDMRDSLPEVNEEREQQGFPALTLDGWDEKPHYDKGKHQLVWCLRVSDKEGSSANYNTRVLGRKGHVSINLVTESSRVATDKPHALAMLAATQFTEGARYEDFDASQDKVAEYGLAGLVAGGAGIGALKLVKLGLLAKMWKVILALLIAGKKVIFVALLGLGALIKKLLARSNTTTE